MLLSYFDCVLSCKQDLNALTRATSSEIGLLDLILVYFELRTYWIKLAAAGRAKCEWKQNKMHSALRLTADARRTGKSDQRFSLDPMVCRARRSKSCISTKTANWFASGSKKHSKQTNAPSGTVRLGVGETFAIWDFCVNSEAKRGEKGSRPSADHDPCGRRPHSKVATAVFLFIYSPH